MVAPRTLSLLAVGSALWQRAYAYGLAQLFEREHVGGQRLAILKLDGTVAALGVEVIKQRGRALAIGEVRNVARLLRLLQVSGLIQADDFLIALDRLITVADVGQDNLLRGLGGKLRLRQGKLRARDLSLVAVEHGQRNVEEERSRVGADNVRIAEGNIQVLHAVGLG